MKFGAIVVVNQRVDLLKMQRRSGVMYQCADVSAAADTNETAGFGGGMEYGIRLGCRITQFCSPDNYRDCSILLNGCFNLQSCFSR